MAAWLFKEKMKKKIVLLSVTALLIIVAVALCVDAVMPNPLRNELDFLWIQPKNNVEFTSESVAVNGKEYFVYAALNDSAAENGDDQYIIAIGRISGINNNKYELLSYNEEEDQFLLSSEYLNIYDYPESEIKTGSNYYGSVYVGTVPASCQSVTINGIAAEMVRQTFELNGEQADFYLYYCMIEQSEYPEHTEVTVTDENGLSYSVSTVDGGEAPIITPIH